MSSKTAGETKVRHLRMTDSLWVGGAVEAQERDGLTISEAVRALLRGYLRGDIEIQPEWRD